LSAENAKRGASIERISSARIAVRLGPSDTSVSTGQHELQSGYDPLMSILYLPSSCLLIFTEIVAGSPQSIGSRVAFATGSNSISVSGILMFAPIV